MKELNRNLKILHLSKQYIKLNGITSSIESIINNDPGNSHFVASDFISNNFLDSREIHYLKVFFKTTLTVFPTNAIKLITLCRKLNISIIHCHHRYYDLLANFVKNFLDVKVITTVQSKVKGKIYFSYKSDKLIVVGESIKEHLEQYFGVSKARITVINNFISPNQIVVNREANEIREELNVDFSQFIIGFVGRFDFHEKGIDVLVNALKIVSKENKKIVAIFIGAGNDKEFILKGKKEMDQRLIILDPKNNVHNYMQIFDMFVLPSRIDPFPLVMLEAAYLKIPFIGSRVDGISEFVNEGEDGFLFESENANELADKIIELINSKSKRVAFADNAFKKLIENYTVDQKLKEYQKIYSTIANEKNFTKTD